MIPKHKQKLTYLQWQDAHSMGGWLSEKELDTKIQGESSIVEEVGWIVHEDKNEIHMVARRTTWNKEDSQMKDVSEFGMYQRIPRTWIKKRKVITI